MIWRSDGLLLLRISRRLTPKRKMIMRRNGLASPLNFKNNIGKSLMNYNSCIGKLWMIYRS